MDPILEKILISKQTAIKSLSLNGNELTINKSVLVKGDNTCNKLTCNSIEVKSTGNKTMINNAIITKSTLDSTPIGIIIPASGKFTKVVIESSSSGDSSQSFKCDGDITIFNTDKQTRFINCLSNPLNIKTNEHLILTSQKKLDLFTTDTNFITNTFNINTSLITSTGYLHITNNTNSTSLTDGSLIVDGGIAISKNITLGGSINSLINTPNNIKGSLNVENNISTSGSLIVNNTNHNNALNVNGGVIIKKNVNIYDSLTLHNNINILNNNNSTNIIQGSTIIKNNLTVYNNLNILQNINTKGTFLLNNNTDSTSSYNGALVVNGGVGIKKNINIDGNSQIKGNFISINITDSTDINSGSMIIYGGVSIAKNLNVGKNTSISGSLQINGNCNILNNEESINTQTGSLVTNGGVAIKKNLNINGIQHIINNTDSTNINNGALIVNGGVAINKNLNIAGNSTINGNLTVNNTLTVKNKSYFEEDVYLQKDIHIDNIYIKGNILNENSEDIELQAIPGKYTDLEVMDDLVVSGADQSFDIETGSIITNGGVGIRKSVNIGEDLTVLGNSTFSNNVNCLKTLYADNIFVKYNITSSEGNISGAGGTAGLVGEPTVPFDTLVGNLNISNNISISNAFSSIDQWINTNIIDTPPILTSTQSPLINGEFIQLEFNLPTQIYVGFLNKKLPIINALYIDYKKSTDTTYTTINMNSITINTIRIYPFTYTNYSNNNTFYLFNILKEIPYDFRIYAKNYNSIRPNKYLIFNSLQTTTSDLLEPPSNINIINNINSPTSSIDLNWTHSISLNIPIYQYNIKYDTLDSIKYPQYIEDSNNSTITSSNIIYNSNNFTTINNLYPGHTYNVNIQSKNILHNTFGTFSNTDNTITTDYPISPAFINNRELYILNNSNYYFNINSGYSLNGTTFIPNIYNYNKLDDTFETNIISDLRINENISTTDLNTTQIISNLNNTYSNLQVFNNINLNGFSHTSNSTIFTDKFNIKLTNEDDYYNDIFNNGFYKKIDLQIAFKNSTDYLLPSSSPYLFTIQQNLPYSNTIYNSKTLELNVDNLNNFTELSNLNFITDDLNNSQFSYISGVPVIVNGNINFDFQTKYLTSNFLRNDKKHFSIFLNNNNTQFSENNNITFDTIQNTNNFYYNTNETKHNTNGKNILPNTNDLLFKNQTIKIINSGYSNDVKLNIILYNLHGEKKYNFSTKLIIDNNSINVKNNINSSYKIHGLQVKSGNTKYPEILYTDFGSTYNHLTNLNTNMELQLVNGYFSTPYNNNTFLDYTNYFNNTNLQYYNYNSIVPDTSFRYVTFKFNDIINDINKITIDLIDTNINEILTSNFELFIRIINENDSSFNTAWLDANKSIDINGLNNNTKNINGTGCLSMFNDFKSTFTRKYCYLPNGSLGSLYVKLGFISNKDFLIKYIKVTPNFI